jgi:group I intron endonuclease
MFQFHMVLYAVLTFIPEVFMEHVIYKIINLTNNKFYVGSTTNKKVRFRNHRQRLRKGVHHSKHLQASWNKYGEDGFAFVVVAHIPDGESLQATEDLWLAAHVGKPYCYNKSRYSDAPMRGVPKEKHPRFGSTVSDTERAAISTALKKYYAKAPENHPRYGKPHTAETKLKISASRAGKMAGENHYRYGRIVSEATRKKIGDTQRGVAKAPRVYTEQGLRKVRETMLKNAKKQETNMVGTVIAKFPLEVQQRYDFTNAVYTGALNRITGCVCPKHGVFSQYSAQFRKGRGCPMCGAVTRGEKKSIELKAKWKDPEIRQKMIKRYKQY